MCKVTCDASCAILLSPTVSIETSFPEGRVPLPCKAMAHSPKCLAMRQACFRVAKISFYIRDYTFYLCSLQISCLMVSKTTFPQFDNLICDRLQISYET